MDIKVMRNFVEIVDSGSLTAASKKLFLAQPALSNQLKTLEGELGAVLIERNSRHQRLTDAGRLFYERAKTILALEGSLIREIEDVREGEVGHLKIATVHSGEMLLLQKVLPTFAARYPKVTYRIFEKESDVLLSMLKDGVADVALVRTPCLLTDEMEVRFIGDEKLVCVFDPELFDLKGHDGKIAVSELQGAPLLLVHRYEEMFLELCREAMLEPNLRCVNQQLSITLRWAEAGLGVAIIPQDMLIHGSRPLSCLELEGEGTGTQRALVTMKNSYQSKAVKNFLACCETLL